MRARRILLRSVTLGAQFFVVMAGGALAADDGAKVSGSNPSKRLPVATAASGGSPQASRTAPAGKVFPQDAFRCGKDLPVEETARIRSATQRSYGELKSLEASFVQESTSGTLGVSEETTGTARLVKPGLMRWDYDPPDAQVFLVREETVWFYQAREKQLLIDQFREVLISDLPVAFLMGLGNLERDFATKSGCRNDHGYVLSLSERRKNKDSARGEGVSNFTLLVDGERYVPRGVSVIDTGGNATKIFFRTLIVNPDVNEDVFKPDFPKGIDVVDRRNH